MTFAGRLIAGIIAILVVTVTVLVLGAERSLRQDLESEVRTTLEREAGLVRELLPADSAAWQATAIQLARAGGVRVTIMDKTGRVRADSDVPAEQLARVENHAGRPEMAAALLGRIGSNTRKSVTIGADLMYVAVLGGPGVVRVAMPLTQVAATVSRAQRPIVVAAILALLLGIGLSLVAARSISGPLADIGLASRAIATGGVPRFPHSDIPDIESVVGSLRSMHEQLRDRFAELNRRQAETGALVDAMVEGVISSDAKGRVITANPAARKLLGYSNGVPLPELPLLFHSKPARAMIDAVLSGQPDEQELEIDERICLVSSRPLPTGGAVLVLHDLTHLRRLETVRRDFVANVSHELKTPLTAISGYAETLLADSVDADTLRRFLGTILSNAKRMHRLVDDQLDLSRIESGRWTASPDRVDVGQAFQDAWAQFTDGRRALPAFSIEVPAEAQFATVDPDALRQILRNLLENAIRYTPPSGRIIGRASALPDGIDIAVVDTGSGIAGEHLPRIFERFYRIDPARSREDGGTGLGLSIVKHLVEAHGGRVWAESDLGRGTSIHCFFPFTAVSAGPRGF